MICIQGLRPDGLVDAVIILSSMKDFCWCYIGRKMWIFLDECSYFSQFITLNVVLSGIIVSLVLIPVGLCLFYRSAL